MKKEWISSISLLLNLKRTTLNAFKRDEIQKTGDKVWFCIKPLVEISLMNSANNKKYSHTFTIPQSAIKMVKERSKKIGTDTNPYYERVIFDLISSLDKSGYTWEVDFPDNDSYNFEKIKVTISWDNPRFIGYKES